MGNLFVSPLMVIFGVAFKLDSTTHACTDCIPQLLFACPSV
jgi:hypothetical protein